MPPSEHADVDVLRKTAPREDDGLPDFWEKGANKQRRTMSLITVVTASL